ncbi:MAG: shikimate dehydrogenase [Candidatus Krumholzibacteria bacterium]|nr:shikimate dehydrogenase [Candidatus Krumholzibacteria bacterium]
MHKKLYCLIGDPVDHSLSPFIMNRAFGECRLDAVYSAFAVSMERLPDAIHGLRSRGFVGANVTYPLKELSRSLADRATPAVDLIEAVNILRFTDEGILADNTDAVGTTQALEVLGATPVSGKRVFVFGGGGAARAVAYGLLQAGARAVTFGVRDAKKAQRTVDRYRRAFPGCCIDCYLVANLTRDRGVFDLVDIIINATTVGMVGFTEGRLLTDDSVIRDRHCCLDLVYHPRETAFIKAARHRGAKTVDGLAPLVAQARAGFRLWTGKDFSLTEMYGAVSAHIADGGVAQTK